MCFSPKHGLIFIWIFEPGEIRAYSWEDGEVRFTISLPFMQPPLMVLTRDEQYLYVRHGKEHNQPDIPTIRKYSMSDLLGSAVVSNPKGSAAAR